MTNKSLLAGLLALGLALPQPSAACHGMFRHESPVSKAFLIGAIPTFGAGYLGGAAACLPLGVVSGAFTGNFLGPSAACGMGLGLVTGAVGGAVVLPLGLVIVGTSAETWRRRPAARRWGARSTASR